MDNFIPDSMFEKFVKDIRSCDPDCRRRKISTEYVLRMVLYVLHTGIAWKHIRGLECHYSTLSKRFRNWVTLGVFENCYIAAVDEYCYRTLSQDILHFKNVFVDCSMIKSRGAVSECTGPNHYDRFRSSTKLSCICDKNRVPLTLEFYPANVSDIKTLEETYETIQDKLTINKRYTVNVIADKGYVNHGNTLKNMMSMRANLVFEEKVYKKKVVLPRQITANKDGSLRKPYTHKVTYVPKHPERQPIIKRVLTPSHKVALAQRSTIEHVFCRFDKFERIHFRSDKRIATFKAFHYLAATILVLNATK